MATLVDLADFTPSDLRDLAWQLEQTLLKTDSERCARLADRLWAPSIGAIRAQRGHQSPRMPPCPLLALVTS